MSLEQGAQAFIQAIAAAVVQQLAASGLGAPQAAPNSYPQQPAPPQAPPQQYAPPPQAPAQQPMAPPPMQQYTPPPPPQAPQSQYPFHDNVTASAWISDIWNKACAVNEEVARADFGVLLGQLGTADLNSLTPGHFPILFNGGQALKAKLGIPG